MRKIVFYKIKKKLGKLLLFSSVCWFGGGKWLKRSDRRSLYVVACTIRTYECAHTDCTSYTPTHVSTVFT